MSHLLNSCCLDSSLSSHLILASSAGASKMQGGGARTGIKDVQIGKMKRGAGQTLGQSGMVQDIKASPPPASAFLSSFSVAAHSFLVSWSRSLLYVPCHCRRVSMGFSPWEKEVEEWEGYTKSLNSIKNNRFVRDWRGKSFLGLSHWGANGDRRLLPNRRRENTEGLPACH